MADRTSAAALDVNRLRLLREVGLRGSIAGAARAVGLTASAVSQQLTIFERETATALLERSSRGVGLTAAGALLAERAADVLDLLAATGAELDRLTGAVAGRVRLAAVTSAAASFVSDAVSGLRETTPQLEISLVAAEPERGIGLLLRGDADIAVVDEYDYVPLALPDAAEVTPLLTEPLVALVPGGDGRRRVRLASLADEFWVMPPEDAACGRAVRAACRAAGFEARVRWETDDMYLLARAVAAGHGVAVLPRRSVVDAVVTGDVGDVGVVGAHVRTLTGPAPTRRLLAVARSSVAARPSVRAVIDALTAASAET